MTSTAVKLQEKPRVTARVRTAPVQPDEYMVQCPACKTLETLFFTNGQLIPNRRFFAWNDKIYHACGTDRPCRIFKNM